MRLISRCSSFRLSPVTLLGQTQQAHDSALTVKPALSAAAVALLESPVIALLASSRRPEAAQNGREQSSRVRGRRETEERERRGAEGGLRVCR
eukprot:393587-Rhodomonas_salina.2